LRDEHIVQNISFSEDLKETWTSETK